MNVLEKSINNYLESGTIFNLPNSQVIVGNNISITLSSTRLEKEKNESIVDNGPPINESIIDISACEALLKKKYGIPEEEELIVVKGDTFIITNSEPGWVEYSCKRFFPNVLDLLSKIKIISARGLYEKKFPNNYKTWKNMAFNDIIKNYELNLPSNIMCMGDSTYEMEAAHGLANKFPDGFIKAIKFKEFPKIEELISQLNLILDKFDFIYSACKNWTITIDKKKKK